MEATRSSLGTSGPAAAGAKIPTIYIGGNGRSGSTLLGRLLGQIDGLVHVGELTTIWTQIPRVRLCGCGKSHRECEFWSEVFADAFGGFDEVDVARILRTKRSLERIDKMPRLLFPSTSARGKDVDYYLNALSALYGSILTVSGASAIVDGSKIPQYAFMLLQAPRLDVSVVHLIRDSRAVAFSWQRKKLNPSSKMDMKTYNPLRTAVKWYIQNWGIRLLKMQADSFAVVRYEDLAADPYAQVSELCATAKVTGKDLSFLHSADIEVGLQHTVTGNPDRFNSVIRIREDQEWQQSMVRSQKWLVTALTYPLLRRYGYSGGSKRST